MARKFFKLRNKWVWQCLHLDRYCYDQKFCFDDALKTFNHFLLFMYFILQVSTFIDFVVNNIYFSALLIIVFILTKYQLIKKYKQNV